MKNKSTRYRMIKDIIGSKVCIDRDTLEIKALLGEPNYKDIEKSRWIYHLGMANRIIMDNSIPVSENDGLNVLRLYLDSSKINFAEHYIVRSK